MCGLGSVIITVMPMVEELKLRSLAYVETELSNFRHPLDFCLSFALARWPSLLVGRSRKVCNYTRGIMYQE